jgi:hypothetical protein
MTGCWCGCNYCFFFTQRDQRFLCHRRKINCSEEQTLMSQDEQCNCAGLLPLIPKHTQGLTRNDPNWKCLFTDLFWVWKVTSTCKKSQLLGSCRPFRRYVLPFADWDNGLARALGTHPPVDNVVFSHSGKNVILYVAIRENRACRELYECVVHKWGLP